MLQATPMSTSHLSNWSIYLPIHSFIHHLLNCVEFIYLNHLPKHLGYASVSSYSPIHLPSHPFIYPATHSSTQPPIHLPSHPFIYPATHSSTQPPIHLPRHPFIYPATHSSTQPPIHLPSHPFIYPDIHSSTYLLTLPSIHLSAHLSTYQFAYTSSHSSVYPPTYSLHANSPMPLSTHNSFLTMTLSVLPHHMPPSSVLSPRSLKAVGRSVVYSRLPQNLLHAFISLTLG